MPVRMIKREELLECEKIQSIAFAYSLDTAELEKLLAEEPGPADPYMGFFNDENVITACVELPEYRVRYEGGWVPMTGIGGVASLPEYRFGGAVRQILQTALRRMAENGTVFSSLYPFSHPYYRQFGYELCQMSMEYELPMEALSKFRCTQKVRMIPAGEPADALKDVFDAHFLRYNLAVRREDRHWKKILGEDSYKECTYTYLLEDPDGPSAYVVLSAENTGSSEKKTGVVREAAFVRPEGLSGVLGLLYRLAAQYQSVRIPLPEDVPLASMIDETYDLKGSFRGQQMTRVISVKKALEKKKHFEGAAYTLSVRDRELPENNGVFHVHCINGSVSVEKEADGGAADLSVDVRTLAQLLLGFLSIDEARYQKDVRVNGNVETLRGVFLKRPVFLTDHF